MISRIQYSLLIALIGIGVLVSLSGHALAAECTTNTDCASAGSGYTCQGGYCIAPASSDATLSSPPASSGGTSGGGLVNPLNNINSLQDLLKAILAAVVQLGTIVLIMALVYVGFLFVVAQGNEEKIRSARSALMWTVIGGLILLGATAIQAVISATVGKL